MGEFKKSTWQGYGEGLLKVNTVLTMGVIYTRLAASAAKCAYMEALVEIDEHVQVMDTPFA